MPTGGQGPSDWEEPNLPKGYWKDTKQNINAELASAGQTPQGHHPGNLDDSPGMTPNQRHESEGFLVHQLNRDVSGVPALGTAAHTSLMADKLDQINWWKQFPDVAAWLTGATLAQKQQEALITHLPSVHDWVQSNTSFNGAKGFLRQAYARALQIKDPAQRLAAVRTLDAFRELSPAEQDAMTQYMKGTGKYANTTLLAAVQQLVGASQTPTITTGADGKPLITFAARVGGGYTLGPNGKPLPSSQDPNGVNIAQTAALEAMFPSLQGRIHFDSSGMNFEDLQDSFVTANYTAPFGVGQIESGTTIALGKGLPQKLLGWMSGSGQNIPAPSRQSELGQVGRQYNWGHVAYDAAFGFGQLAFNVALPGLSKAFAVMMMANEISQGATELQGPGGFQTGVGHAIARGTADVANVGAATAGLAAGGPLLPVVNAALGESNKYLSTIAQHTLGVSRTTADGLANMITTAALWGAGQAGNAFKEEINVAPDAESARTADETSPFSPTSTHPEPTRVWDDTSWETKVLHPVQSALRPLVQDWVRSMAEDTGLASFFRRGSWRPIFDDAAKLAEDKNLTFEQKLGALTERHQTLAKNVARAILSTDREHMPVAAADAIEAQDVVGIPDGESLADAQARTQDLVRQKTVLENRHSLLGIPASDTSDATTTAEQSFDAYTRQQQLQDQIDALDSQIEEAQQLEQEANARALASLNPKDLQWTRPTNKTLPQFLHRVFYPGDGRLGTTLEKSVRAILAPSRTAESWTPESLTAKPVKQPFLTKFVDAWPREGLRNPASAQSATEATDIQDKNTAFLTRMLTRLGVSQGEIDWAIGRAASITSPQEFSHFVDKELYGTSGLVSRYLPANLDPGTRNRILSTSTRDPLNYAGGVPVRRPDGSIGYEPTLYKVQDGTQIPLPVGTNEFRDRVESPSVTDIDQVVNRWKRLAENAGKPGKSFPFRAVSLFHKWTGFLGSVLQAMKATTLALNLHTVLAHKTANEVLENVVNPQTVGVGKVQARDLGLLNEKPYGDAESLREMTIRNMEDFAQESQQVPVQVSSHSILDNIDDPANQKVAAQGILEMLDHARTDEVSARLAQEGLTPEAVQAVIDAMHGGDPTLTRHYEQNLKPLLSDPQAVAAIAQSIVDQSHSQGYESEGRTVTPEEQAQIDQRGADILASTQAGPRSQVLVDISPEMIATIKEALGEEWGGKTIDVKTGQFVDPEQGYAGGVVPNSETVTRSIEDAQDPVKLQSAIQYAEKKFADELARPNHYLGIFRDEKKGIVTIEPSIIVQDKAAAEAIATHLGSDGGFYDFSTGKGVFPSRLSDADLLDQVSHDPEAILREVLTRKATEINDITMQGHPDFVQYVANGLLPRQGETAALPDGLDIKDDYEHVAQTVEAIRARLTSEKQRPVDDATQAAIKADQLALREALSRMRDIENGTGSKPEVLVAGKDAALRDEIIRRIGSGEVRPPAQISVQGNVSWLHKDGSLENAKGAAKSMEAVMYKFLKPVGAAELYGPKGAYFTQRVHTLEQQFLDSGWDAGTAHEMALLRGIADTKDLFYDMASRSTIERSVKHWFWFAPVTAQLLYHWGYAIPATQGAWLPGVALTYAKLAEYQNLFKSMGVLHEATGPDGTKELAFGLPGTSALVNMLTGSQLKGNMQVPLQGVFTHVLGGVPSLNPVASTLIQKFIAPHVPAVESISNQLAPYTSTSLFPSDIHSLLGAFGIPLPDVMPSYVKDAYDKTYDVSLQYAFTSMYERGDRQPTPEQFTKNGVLDQAAYVKARQAWYNRLWSLSRKDGHGLFLLKAAFGGMQAWYTSSEQQAYYDWYNKNVAPKLKPGVPEDDALRALEQQWLSQHPQSLAFSISTGEYTGKNANALPDALDYTEKSRAEYAQGIKQHFSPEDYIHVLSGLSQRAYYEAKTNAAVAKIAGNGPPGEQVANLLSNWGERRAAVEKLTTEWQRYRDLNPTTASTIDKAYSKMHDAYGTPPKNIEGQFATAALTNLVALKDQMPAQEYAVVAGKLRQLISATYQATGGKPTEVEQGINWYFQNVIDPYFKQTQPLYDQIDALKAASAGPEATAGLFQQISAIKDSLPTQWKGTTLPGIDEFFYGEKGRNDQALERIHWASEPVSFLSAFQRQTVGYRSFTNEDQFWAAIGAQQSRTANYLAQQGWSSSSPQYQSTKAWEARQEQAIAAKYGPEAVAALNLDNQAPAFHLAAVNTAYGQNGTFQNILQMVQYVNSQDAKDNYAYGTKSAYIDQLKGWVYSAVQQGEQSDPQFLQLMENLSLSTKIQGTEPRGVPLYEAIFFDNWTPQYENAQLRSQYAPTQGIY